ncbi:hypothetical protein [Brevibacillus porteri]|uniref:Terminase n=1 Tax=Brevibacillus porteri TaxID=2126350 RepID=A0ABX5FIB5_9BACL|nr:hypothetical protein [Brevibacillus porteri]MED1802916.1 hypothetical protein [Brevibacillus porteri]MED2135092.1 hypothetical protein [Brevibacillus porteri]MED2746334.1 hypothetical protein [Brevibacillus porteri]MED2817918.1 hypothetical protein [Brevibacillus porteri]MED2895550.1 hypothetical protein [Brevibacillus porteri]
MRQARALLAEAQRLQTLVSDDERLRNEFPRISRPIADTFRDYEDHFRYQWHQDNGRGRLLYARYLSIAQDLRISTTILRGAVRYKNAGSIEVKRAEIRQAVRKLAGLIRDGVRDEPDEVEHMGAIEALI